MLIKRIAAVALFSALLTIWQYAAMQPAAAQSSVAAPVSSSEKAPPKNSDAAESILEDFRKPPAKPWRWIREHRDGWRIADQGLQVLIEPGNMWGDANDARNVLVRPIPAEWRDGVEVSVQVGHRPKKRWEQADLAWYYNDGTMVKLGLEIENDVTNIVMGREEGDKTQTIAVIPYDGAAAQLRFIVEGRKLTGYYRRPANEKWSVAGECELPSSPDLEAPQASLQFYQGEAGSDRWATVSKFRLTKLPAATP